MLKVDQRDLKLQLRKQINIYVIIQVMKYKEFDVLQVLSDTGIILSQGSYSLSQKKIRYFP